LKIKALISILVLSSLTYSHEYLISNKTHEFIHIDGKLVSLNCKLSCLAKSRKVTTAEVEKFDNKFGKNPATAACKFLGGEIVLAKSKLGHKTFFCKFKDNSYIHSGHLL
jgi:hypothetical protein